MQLPKRVVLDTCVVLDMVVASRPSHAYSLQLFKLLNQFQVTPVFPMHGVFEIGSAVSRKRYGAKNGTGEPFARALTEDMPLQMKLLAIDEAFLKRYMPGTPPGTRAGDTIFLRIAEVDEIPLITEDSKLYKEAKRLDIQVFTSEEFVHFFDPDKT